MKTPSKDWLLYSFFVLVNLGLISSAFICGLYRYGFLTGLIVGTGTLALLVVIFLIGKWLSRGEEEID